MKFHLFHACEGSGFWVIGTALILLLFMIQSIWGIVDSARPENAVSKAMKDAGVYAAAGGQNAGSASNTDVGGTVYSSLMLVLVIVLTGFFVKSVVDCNNLAAFNPFRKLGK
jgi:hypothetical protein